MEGRQRAEDRGQRWELFSLYTQCSAIAYFVAFGFSGGKNQNLSEADMTMHRLKKIVYNTVECGYFAGFLPLKFLQVWIAIWVWLYLFFYRTSIFSTILSGVFCWLYSYYQIHLLCFSHTYCQQAFMICVSSKYHLTWCNVYDIFRYASADTWLLV